MSTRWEDHDGLMMLYDDNVKNFPIMYIITKDAPPWKIEMFDGTVGEFDTLEAAQLALIIRRQGSIK